MPFWEKKYDKISKKEFVDVLTVDILYPSRGSKVQISKPYPKGDQAQRVVQMGQIAIFQTVTALPEERQIASSSKGGDKSMANFILPLPFVYFLFYFVCQLQICIFKIYSSSCFWIHLFTVFAGQSTRMWTIFSLILKIILFPFSFFSRLLTRH